MNGQQRVAEEMNVCSQATEVSSDVKQHLATRWGCVTGIYLWKCEGSQEDNLEGFLPTPVTKSYCIVSEVSLAVFNIKSCVFGSLKSLSCECLNHSLH